MFRKILLLLAFIFAFQSEMLSQQYYFRKYSVEEGLPHSSVWCFMQDSRGYIWMGTIGGGVTKFDGFRFVTYTTENGLTDNIVRSLLEDSKGNIWIGTDNGLTVYDGEKFTQIKKENGLGGTSVLKIIESRSGIIWAGTNDGGLSAIRPGDSLKITNFSIGEGLLSTMVYDICEAADNRLWLAMAGGVNILETEGGDTIKIKKIDDPLVPSELATSVAPLDDGSFLVGMRYYGLFKVTPDKNGYQVMPSHLNNEYRDLTVWDIIVRPDKTIWLATDKNGILRLSGDEITGTFSRLNGFPSNRVMNGLIDNEGNTWFATLDKGAIMFSDEKFISYGIAEGIPGNQVLSIYFDNDNSLYIASEEGFTCFRRNKEKILRTGFFNSANGLNNQAATAITKYDSEIWIGTSNGLNTFGKSGIRQFRLNYQLPDLNINTLLTDSHNNLWIGTSGGLSRYYDNEIFSLTQDNGLPHNEIQTILEDSKGRIWIGTSGGLARINNPESRSTVSLTTFDAAEGLNFLRINTLAEDPAGNIWIGTFGGGIYKFDNSLNTLPISLITAGGILSSDNVNSLLFMNDSSAIAGTDKGFDLLELDSKQSIRRAVHFGITDGFTGGENNPNSIAKDNEGSIWFGTKSGMVRFNPSLEMERNQSPRTFISGIRLFFKEVDWKARKVKTARWSGMPENLVLSHKDNHVTFIITGFFYNNPGDLLFSYYLYPQSKEWSPYSPEREIQFASLSSGNYTIQVKSKNKYGFEGNISEFNFIIKPPFYKTSVFIFSCVILLLLSTFTFFRIRERNLIIEKIKLEKIVVERTREVVQQKDEIARQRDVVTSQKKEITDSINYAERIQKAVLPDDNILKEAFSEYLIILRPKDIVSGDFYWMSSKDDKFIIAAADCTGHGVPGAFMSMLGVSFLNKIVNESFITDPSEILNLLRQNVINALKQKGAFEEAKDGMDIALCCVDTKNMKLWFSGANNPLYLIRQTESQYTLTEIKADLMPVGVYADMPDFSCQELDVSKGDTFYLFSDGFRDQFGGILGKKFTKNRFRQMLLDNQGSPLEIQKEIFNKTLDDWMNYPSENHLHKEQVDDILLLGFRI